jgi:hypothetical protein
VIPQRKGIRLLLDVESTVRAAGCGDVSYAEGFEQIAQQHADDIVKIGIHPRRLMPVVHENGELRGLDPHRVVKRVGVIPIKEQGFVVITQRLEKPALRGKAVKEPVELGPPGANGREGIALEFFDVPVQEQIPAGGEVAAFQNVVKQRAIKFKVVAPAASHVEIACHDNFIPPGNINYRFKIKAGTEYIGEKRIVKGAGRVFHGFFRSMGHNFIFTASV